MKKLNIIMVIFFLKRLLLIGQIGPDASFVPGGYNLSSGVNLQAQNSIVAGVGGYNATAAGKAFVEGVNYAAALPGYQASGFTGPGFACLRINNELPRLASFHPGGFSGILKYERFEIGVNLLPFIQNQINTFLQTGLNGSNRINPYDPDQIRVECTYILQGSNPTQQFTRHGFYKAADIDVISATDTWSVTADAPEYFFRVRFAPPEVGYWKGTVKVYLGTNTTPTYTSHDFGFNVVADNNPGHLTMTGSSKVQKMKYLDNGQIFYGVGRNVAYAEFDQGMIGGTNVNECGPGPGQAPPYYEMKSIPSTHLLQRKYIRDLSINGCNFLRVRLNRWSVPIEETPICEQRDNLTNLFTPPFNPRSKDLTNFSKNEKFMWEMDSTLQTCEMKKMHMLLTILDEGDLAVQNFVKTVDGVVISNSSASLGWWGNPYRMISSVNNRNDFFTDPNALNTFKKRLYYIEARWGYSTSIGAWEMFNETEFLGGSDTLTSFDQTTSNLVGAWLCNMRSYLQGTSVYPQHPFSNGVSQQPWMGTAVNWNQTNTANNCLDFYTDHCYASEMSVPANPPGAPGHFHASIPTIQEVSLFYSNYWGVTTGPFSNALNNKPHLIGEYGLDPIARVMLYGPLTFHNQNWGSIFANSMSIALQWCWWYLPNINSLTPGGPINPFHAQYKPLRTFVDRIDFNTRLLPDRNTNNPGWRPNAYPYWDDDFSPAQTYWMRTLGQDTIYGWTQNTTANFMADGYAPAVAAYPLLATTMQTNYNFNGTPNPSSNYINQGSSATFLQGLLSNTLYDIEVYDTWNPSGAQLGSFSISSDPGGLLVFDASFAFDMPFNPPTGSNPSPPYPDYAFIARKHPVQPKSSESTSLTGNNPSKHPYGKVKIYPVPASEKIYISLTHEEWSDPIAYLIDELGKQIEKPLNKDFSIDVKDFPNGFYILKIKDVSHEATFKVVIQR